MRILYHHRTLGDGAEGIHIREMVHAFRMLGYEVTVAGPTGEPGISPKKKPGGRLGLLKQALPGWLFELLEVAYSVLCFLDLGWNIRKKRPDFIYDRYITFNVGSLWAARWYGIPLVLEVNAPLALERSSEPDERLYLKRLAFFLERHICSRADVTIVVSTPLKRYLESIGVPVDKCVVMPNGVNRSSFQPAEKNRALMASLGVAAGSKVIGFAGILRPWHGVELIVAAVAHLRSLGKDVYLLIVGDGPMREKIETSMQEAGLTGHAQVTGRVSHEEIPRYINLFDIAVSPKATFYASPMKVVEYMALGKAVVAPDTENFQDLVDHGSNGMLFVSDSGAALSSSLESLCDCEALRREMGRKAREKVEQRLNWEWNAREVGTLVAGCRDLALFGKKAKDARDGSLG